MAYDGFKVYKIYLAVKLHFTTKYDYTQYGGKVNATLESFTKRKDRYFFHKLSKKYAENEILDFFIANFTKDSKGWIGNLLDKDGESVYLDYKKRKDAFEYHFKSDCILVRDDFVSRGISFDDGLRVHGGQHPRLLQLFLQKKLGLQTLIIMDRFISFTKTWDKEIAEKVVWPKIKSTLTRMKSFVRYNEVTCKLILKQVFVEGE